MSSKFDYDAPVAYIRDAIAAHAPGEFTERRLGLANAVRLALERHKPGETPAITGTGIQLNGIDAIRAVRSFRTFRPIELQRPYNGMLSCFFQGFCACLLRSMLRARQMRRRVPCGMITSSM